MEEKKIIGEKEKIEIIYFISGAVSSGALIFTLFYMFLNKIYDFNTFLLIAIFGLLSVFTITTGIIHLLKPKNMMAIDENNVYLFSNNISIPFNEIKNVKCRKSSVHGMTASGGTIYIFCKDEKNYKIGLIKKVSQVEKLLNEKIGRNNFKSN